LQTLIGQEADLIRERRVAAADLMANFVTILKPDQRKAFARRVGLLPPPGPDDRPQGSDGRPAPLDGPGAGPGPAPGQDGPGPRGAGADRPNRDRDGNRRPGDRRFNPGPEVMKRFDADKNGRLDPEEAQAARQELEARRREFAPGDRNAPRQGDPGNPGS